MDLWQLHIFCKVVELKSFSKAGDAVHISQPTISSHIKDLEDHFGCRLIDRLSKNVSPTKAGELLYDYARQLLALKDETETAISEFQGKIKGSLSAGGSTIPGTYMLPKLMGGFLALYPGVNLSLTIGDTLKITTETANGNIEISIVGALSDSKMVSQEKIFNDEMRLIICENHKWAARSSVTLDELVKEPFILREDGSGTRKAIEDSLRNVGASCDDLNAVVEMGSTEAVIQGVKNGVGVSIVSPVALSDVLSSKSISVLSIEGVSLSRSFYLTVHGRKTLSPLAASFRDYIKKELK